MTVSGLMRKSLIWLFNQLDIHRNNIDKVRRRFYAQQHQLTSTTSADRYPELFNEAVRVTGLSAQTQIKILSFGCSTGEECMSLKRYFPGARITGVDINKGNLKKATRLIKSKDIKFLYSTPENIKGEGEYDLIFCLSVLCRWEDTKYLNNCEDVYSFDKFSATISMLSSNLKNGGLFVIYNSNFRFEDTAEFKDFEIVITPTIESSGFVNKFNKMNMLISEAHSHCIYRKNK